MFASVLGRQVQNIGDISEQFRSGRYYVFFFVTAGIAALGMLASLTGSPLVLPSVGATLFIVFAFPLAAGAEPRNVICSYLVGTASGIIGLAAFGLISVPADITHLGEGRVGATTVAVGLTVLMLRAFRLVHIPAIAGSLLVALGLLSDPADWLAQLVAVLVVTATALIINRTFGIAMPLWSADAPQPDAPD